MCSSRHVLAWSESRSWGGRRCLEARCGPAVQGRSPAAHRTDVAALLSPSTLHLAGKRFRRRFFSPKGRGPHLPRGGPQAGRPGPPTLSHAPLCWSLHASGPKTSAHELLPRMGGSVPQTRTPHGVPVATLRLPSHCPFPNAVSPHLPCSVLSPEGGPPFSLSPTQELPQTRTPRLGSLRAGLRVPINPGPPWGRPVPGPSGCFLLEAACAWWLLHLQQIPSILRRLVTQPLGVSSCLDGPGPMVGNALLCRLGLGLSPSPPPPPPPPFLLQE